MGYYTNPKGSADAKICGNSQPPTNTIIEDDMKLRTPWLERRPGIYRPSIAYTPREYHRSAGAWTAKRRSRRGQQGARPGTGRHPLSDGNPSTPVVLRHPAAKTASLLGTFTKWKERGISFNRLPDGNWFLQILLLPAATNTLLRWTGRCSLTRRQMVRRPTPSSTRCHCSRSVENQTKPCYNENCHECDRRNQSRGRWRRRQVFGH